MPRREALWAGGCSGVTHFKIIPGSTPEGGVYPV